MEIRGGGRRPADHRLGHLVFSVGRLGQAAGVNTESAVIQTTKAQEFHPKPPTQQPRTARGTCSLVVKSEWAGLSSLLPAPFAMSAPCRVQCLLPRQTVRTPTEMAVRTAAAGASTIPWCKSRRRYQMSLGIDRATHDIASGLSHPLGCLVAG